MNEYKQNMIRIYSNNYKSKQKYSVSVSLGILRT